MKYDILEVVSDKCSRHICFVRMKDGSNLVTQVYAISLVADNKIATIFLN